MSHPWALLSTSLLCCLLTGQPGRGEPPARTDRYGDALPPGVVARLGTERLALQQACFLTFSPDGRYMAAHDGGGRLRVWDAASGKEVLRLTTQGFVHGHGPGMKPLAFSPDSKAIALGTPGNPLPGGDPHGSVHV